MFPRQKHAVMPGAPARHRIGRFAALCIATGIVGGIAGGCVPETVQWSPAQAIHKNEVRYVTFEHEIRFPATSTKLGTEERRRLNAFLARHDAGYGDQLYVGAVGRLTDAGEKRAEALESEVMRYLRDGDAETRLLQRGNSRTSWNGAVTLVLGRYVVIPPRCPDWRKESSGDASNTNLSNFGCATETNLGLMVANPAHLVHGDRPGPADGSKEARTYGEYRTGEGEKELREITPLDLESGLTKQKDTE